MMYLLEKRGEEPAVFDRSRYLEECFALPARKPEQYWKPERKKVTPYIADISVLNRHEAEVEAFKGEGVPPYLARAMVLNMYCDKFDTLKQRIEKQKLELRP